MNLEHLEQEVKFASAQISGGAADVWRLHHRSRREWGIVSLGAQ